MPQEASMAEILQCREERAQEQRRLLAAYGKPLLSFTVNMPGPAKLCPESRYMHERGTERMQAALARAAVPVLYFAARERPGGPEAFFVVDAPAHRVKALACAVEDGSPLGRLFDLDVLEPATGRPLQRESVGRPKRSCLLCGQEAAVCARSRAHSVQELLEHIRALVAQDMRGGGKGMEGDYGDGE